jgi:hypothetical protein
MRDGVRTNRSGERPCYKSYEKEDGTDPLSGTSRTFNIDSDD